MQTLHERLEDLPMMLTKVSFPGQRAADGGSERADGTHVAQAVLVALCIWVSLVWSTVRPDSGMPAGKMPYLRATLSWVSHGSGKGQTPPPRAVFLGLFCPFFSQAWA